MRCCVVGCQAPPKGVSIFRLIRKGKFREDWVQAIEELNDQIIDRSNAAKQISICESHFDNSYLRSFGHKRYLIHDAVPTIFPEKKPSKGIAVKKKRRLVCYVHQCRKFQVPGISMHRIPKRVLSNPKEALRWRGVLKMRLPFPNHFVLCSRHFERNQILYPTPKGPIGRRGIGFLVENAFPTLNLPKPPISIDLAKGIIAKYERFNERREEFRRYEKNYQEEFKLIDLTESDEIETTEATSPTETEIEITEPIVGRELPFIPVGRQTPNLNENEFETTPLDVLPFNLNTDSKLKIMTGIPNRKILKEIVSKCNEFTVSVDMIEIPSLENKIIFTMYRLKNNVCNDHTAILFNMSTETSKTFFANCIKLLSRALKCFIRWPTREACKKNVPTCFKPFENCVTVLYCRDLKTIQPACDTTTCGSASCSHLYKGPKNIKVLVGIAPSGLVNYISPSALGRYTNRANFNITILLEILGPSDAVMVSKGCIISKDLFKSHGIELIIEQENNPDQKDILKNRRIAAAQLHIENRISVVNSFKIFSERFPLNMLPFIDSITITICAISNMVILKES